MFREKCSNGTVTRGSTRKEKRWNRYRSQRLLQICYSGHPRQVRATAKCLKIWWTRPGSNRRPHRCERCALPAELLAHPCQFTNYSTTTTYGISSGSVGTISDHIFGNSEASLCLYASVKCIYLLVV